MQAGKQSVKDAKKREKGHKEGNRLDISRMYMLNSLRNKQFSKSYGTIYD